MLGVLTGTTCASSAPEGPLCLAMDALLTARLLRVSGPFAGSCDAFFVLDVSCALCCRVAEPGVFRGDRRGCSGCGVFLDDGGTGVLGARNVKLKPVFFRSRVMLRFVSYY